MENQVSVVPRKLGKVSRKREMVSQRLLRSTKIRIKKCPADSHDIHKRNFSRMERTKVKME